MRIKLDNSALERAIENSPGLVDELRDAADGIARRIRPPASAELEVFTLADKGPRGPFAQAVMRGEAALAVEFGSRNNPPYAPVRRAVRGG